MKEGQGPGRKDRDWGGRIGTREEEQGPGRKDRDRRGRIETREEEQGPGRRDRYKKGWIGTREEDRYQSGEQVPAGWRIGTREVEQGPGRLDGTRVEKWRQGLRGGIGTMEEEQGPLEKYGPGRMKMDQEKKECGPEGKHETTGPQIICRRKCDTYFKP